MLEAKDIATISLSTVGFVFAIASFVFTFSQKKTEAKYSNRKALSDVINSLTTVNIAFSKLEMDYPSSSDEKVVNFRRNYNDQRRFLAYHGDMLVEQISDLATDIDCMIIASAFRASGNFEKAQQYYEMAIAKSPTNTVKLNNMRAFARYWFMQNNADRGRKLFQEGLQLEFPATDTVRQFVADTYMIWARVERDNGFKSESERLKERAISAANGIGNLPMKTEMLKQIESMFGGSGK